MGSHTIIHGDAAKDLFTVTSDVGHLTFRGVDGHHYTAVSSYDVDYTCCTVCTLDVLAQLPAITTSDETFDGVPTAVIYGDDTDRPGIATVYTGIDAGDNPYVVCASCKSVLVDSIDVERQPAYVDAVFTAYVRCGLWSTSSYDINGERNNESLEARGFTAADLTDAAVESIREDVTSFVADNWADVRGLDAAQTGHDFLFTRDRHGTGFWDRGLGDVGDRLTSAAHVYGDSGFYVTDDGDIDVQ